MLKQIINLQKNNILVFITLLLLVILIIITLIKNNNYSKFGRQMGGGGGGYEYESTLGPTTPAATTPAPTTRAPTTPAPTTRPVRLLLTDSVANNYKPLTESVNYFGEIPANSSEKIKQNYIRSYKDYEVIKLIIIPQMEQLINSPFIGGVISKTIPGLRADNINAKIDDITVTLPTQGLFGDDPSKVTISQIAQYLMLSTIVSKTIKSKWSNFLITKDMSSPDLGINRKLTDDEVAQIQNMITKQEQFTVIFHSSLLKLSKPVRQAIASKEYVACGVYSKYAHDIISEIEKLKDSSETDPEKKFNLVKRIFLTKIGKSNLNVAGLLATVIAGLSVTVWGAWGTAAFFVEIIKDGVITAISSTNISIGIVASSITIVGIIEGIYFGVNQRSPEVMGATIGASIVGCLMIPFIYFSFPWIFANLALLSLTFIIPIVGIIVTIVITIKMFFESAYSLCESLGSNISKLSNYINNTNTTNPELQEVQMTNLSESLDQSTIATYDEVVFSRSGNITQTGEELFNSQKESLLQSNSSSQINPQFDIRNVNPKTEAASEGDLETMTGDLSGASTSGATEVEATEVEGEWQQLVAIHGRGVKSLLDVGSTPEQALAEVSEEAAAVASGEAEIVAGTSLSGSFAGTLGTVAFGAASGIIIAVAVIAVVASLIDLIAGNFKHCNSCDYPFMHPDSAGFNYCYQRRCDQYDTSTALKFNEISGNRMGTCYTNCAYTYGDRYQRVGEEYCAQRKGKNWVNRKTLIKYNQSHENASTYDRADKRNCMFSSDNTNPSSAACKGGFTHICRAIFDKPIGEVIKVFSQQGMILWSANADYVEPVYPLNGSTVITPLPPAVSNIDIFTTCNGTNTITFVYNPITAEVTTRSEQLDGKCGYLTPTTPPPTTAAPTTAAPTQPPRELLDPPPVWNPPANSYTGYLGGGFELGPEHRGAAQCLSRINDLNTSSQYSTNPIIAYSVRNYSPVQGGWDGRCIAYQGAAVNALDKIPNTNLYTVCLNNKDINNKCVDPTPPPTTASPTPPPTTAAPTQPPYNGGSLADILNYGPNGGSITLSIQKNNPLILASSSDISTDWSNRSYSSVRLYMTTLGQAVISNNPFAAIGGYRVNLYNSMTAYSYGNYQLRFIYTNTNFIKLNIFNISTNQTVGTLQSANVGYLYGARSLNLRIEFNISTGLKITVLNAMSYNELLQSNEIVICTLP